MFCEACSLSNWLLPFSVFYYENNNELWIIHIELSCFRCLFRSTYYSEHLAPCYDDESTPSVRSVNSLTICKLPINGNSRGVYLRSTIKDIKMYCFNCNSLVLWKIYILLIGYSRNNQFHHTFKNRIHNFVLEWRNVLFFMGELSVNTPEIL